MERNEAGDEGDIIPGLPVGKAVVGKFRFAADLIVEGDDSLLFHSFDVCQPAFRFCNIPGEYLLLFVQAEQVKVLPQQGDFYIRLIIGRAQEGDLFFQGGPFYGVTYSAALVYGLEDVQIVILLPVGRVGMYRAGESLPEDDRLPQVAGGSSCLNIGKAIGKGVFHLLPGNGFLNPGGMQAQAVLLSGTEQLRQGK